MHRDDIAVSPGYMPGDLWIYGVYSWFDGYWLDTKNDLDAIDNMRPVSKYNQNLGKNVQLIDHASVPEVITEKGHGVKTSDPNGGAINMSSAVALAHD